MLKLEEGRITALVTAGVLTLALLYVAQSVFVPLTFSILVIALIWPLQAALQRVMPRMLALLITLTVTIVAVVAVGSSIAWGLSVLGHWLFVNAGRFQAIYLDWTQWLEEHGVAIAGPLSEQFNVGWLVGMLQGVAGRMNSFAGFTIVIFISVLLGLMEVEDFKRRLMLPSIQPLGALVLESNLRIAAKLRRFMAVRTFASVLTGLVVWIFASFVGLELAAAWGAIAFALNYIPFLGPFIATVFPTLFAIAQFDSWQSAVVVFAGLNLIQFVIGSYFEPRLTGASLAISPFAVIFAVFFWAFMWGLPGAFIGVPILICLVEFGRRIETTRWIAVLLSGEQPPTDAPSPTDR
ncbi:AI-2E family transporter [Rhizobium sp. TRM96647]|uniref:AI-2E family transporter n=1 Tax=unclassified Rhizobium TaxID=2613769 RepID=UPI0021E93542|nr:MULTISPECIES: AI-2E family transporter [unclassified Rhizobium]MCV3737277.1 AI-2E family transporter [Rhizobium sp. TRM96647]MCV3759261.1 AI-2E family transporter [Rhizobium sp. TRM96650]